MSKEVIVGNFFSKTKGAVMSAVELPKGTGVWYFLTVASLITALCVAFFAPWISDPEYVKTWYGFKKVKDAVSVRVFPQTSTLVLASIFYASLLVRKCVRGVTNLPSVILIILDFLLVATLMESIIPAQGISFLGVTPQVLLVIVIVFSWIGMRAIAGIGVLLLAFAFFNRMSTLNADLRWWGSVVVSLSFISLLLQMKLPFMLPEGGFWAALKHDFGFVGHEASENVKATGDAVKKGAIVVLEAGSAAITATIPVAGVATTAAVGKIKEGLLEGSKSESNSNPMLKAQ